jgi:hypothetical protein
MLLVLATWGLGGWVEVAVKVIGDTVGVVLVRMTMTMVKVVVTGGSKDHAFPNPTFFKGCLFYALCFYNGPGDGNGLELHLCQDGG